VNLAAAQADGDALLLLNDDCVVEPDYVERLTAALDPAAVVMAAGVLCETARNANGATSASSLPTTVITAAPPPIPPRGSGSLWLGQPGSGR
jgi:GT2 family glycosyltransferase